MMKTGFKQVTSGLLSETYLEAHVRLYFHSIGNNNLIVLG